MTISMSKIKKMTEIKKNFNEKGTRDNEKGSKPHSKGDNFSLSIDVFIDTKREIITIIRGISIINLILIV